MEKMYKRQFHGAALLPWMSAVQWKSREENQRKRYANF